jgi:hypothetical protein
LQIQDHLLHYKDKTISFITNTRPSPSLQIQDHLLHYKYKTISFITKTKPSPSITNIRSSPSLQRQSHLLHYKYKTISCITNIRPSLSLQIQDLLLHYKYKTISFIANTTPISYTYLPCVSHSYGCWYWSPFWLTAISCSHALHVKTDGHLQISTSAYLLEIEYTFILAHNGQFVISLSFLKCNFKRN